MGIASCAESRRSLVTVTSGNIFFISEFLCEHFKRRGLKAIRIPVIMDVENSKKSRRRNDDMIHLIYAGSPAKKDHLKEITEAVCSLPEEARKKFDITVLGVTNEELKGMCNGITIPQCIDCKGRVPRKNVLKTMENMDFSILLRPENERYTKAGFPTKVVEAMSHRVAMMCNLTSDLKYYLKNKENSIVIQDCSAEACYEVLQTLLTMNRSQIEEIKENARTLAEQQFDYRQYILKMKQFIEE